MSEKRDLAIVGLILGLLGGALVLADAVDFRGRSSFDLAFVISHAVAVVLGVAVLFASLLLYRGRYGTGGILNLILGIVILVYGPTTLGGVLALISGVVGLVANEARA